MSSSAPRSGYSARFLVIAVLFVTCLLASNVAAVKPIELLGYVLPAAIVVFPISYIIGDVLTEVYGFAKARTVIWLGFMANVLMVATFVAAGAIPAAGFWEGSAAFDTVLGATPRILAASFLAYLVGEFTNSVILARLKVATEGRHLWFRTIGSTVVGQTLDSAVFIVVAFLGTWPTSVLLATILAQAAAKIAYEVLATPITYIVVGWLKRSEGMDVYDRDTRFNPFALTR